MMMQHKRFVGEPVALKSRERFSDRMRRIAARNLKEASMDVAAKNPESARWYCLQVAKGREFSVQDDLKGAGVEVFLPTERVGIVSRGVKIERDEPIFPCYVLVRCVASASAFSGLAGQRYVQCIVGGRNGTPHAVSDRIINSFKSLIEAGVPRTTTDKSFCQGDQAEIVAGPFGGFSCTLLAVKWCRQAKARVLIMHDGNAFEIESMPLAFLKKL